MGFGVWGLGFGVWGLGFGVWGVGSQPKSAYFQLIALRSKVEALHLEPRAAPTSNM